MNLIPPDFRLYTDNPQTPSQKQVSRGRMSYYQKNPVNLSISRDRSPKSNAFNESNQIVNNVYTPIGVYGQKKRQSFVNNSLVSKRTLTEADDKMETLNSFNNPQQILIVGNSQKNNNQKQYLNNPNYQIHKKILNKLKQQQNQQSVERKSDKQLDLPQLNHQYNQMPNYTDMKQKELSPKNPYNIDIMSTKNRRNLLYGTKKNSIPNLPQNVIQNEKKVPVSHSQSPKRSLITNNLSVKKNPNEALQTYLTQRSQQQNDNFVVNNLKSQEIAKQSLNQESTMDKTQTIKKNSKNNVSMMGTNSSQIDDNYTSNNKSHITVSQPQPIIQTQNKSQSQDQKKQQEVLKISSFKKELGVPPNSQQSQRPTCDVDDIQNEQVEQAQKNLHPRVQWDMSEEEWNQFGDRFPKAYEKKRLLGRGGFALVWLGLNKKTRERYAVKQILTNNAHQTHIKEIWFGSYFFDNGKPKQKYIDYRGIENFSKMLHYDIQPQDTYIFYELCGESNQKYVIYQGLGSTLYDLNCEGNIGNERIYRIKYKPFYYILRKEPRLLKQLVFELSHSLMLLSDCNIVHSDLKTENILLKILKTQSGYELIQTKLIDYGSAFTFGNLKHFSMATPEYMAPEVLNFILYQNNLRYIPKMLQFLKNYSKAYVIDIWSLGCVLLEIISGLPLWMSLKTIVVHNNQEMIRTGLFAAKGRVFEAIIEKQIEVVRNIDKYLDEENYSGIQIQDDLRMLLKRMLAFDPEKRISPREICMLLGAPDQLNIPLNVLEPPSQIQKPKINKEELNKNYQTNQ